eukprot:3947523-Amphidinium_carterae.1
MDATKIHGKPLDIMCEIDILEQLRTAMQIQPTHFEISEIKRAKHFRPTKLPVTLITTQYHWRAALFATLWKSGTDSVVELLYLD